MTPLAWMWILSALGAITFYAAGYFGARLRRHHTVEVVVPPHAHDDTNPGAEAAALRRELASVRSEKVALATEVAQLAAQARQAHDRADRASRESQALRAELATASAAAASAPAEGRHRRPQTAAEVQEMALELEALRGRVADAEALRSDNAVLRAAAEESRALTRRVGVLEQELQAARAQAFAAAPAPAPAEARPAVPRLRSVPEASTEKSLQQVIDRVARLPGVRAVALADDLGLLVAGAGEHGTVLAAYGGFLAGVGTKASEHLPIGLLRRCAIEDENSTTISVSPLRGQPLMLVTMSNGAGPTQQQVARLLEDAARVVA
jgi:hypothetical protein